MKEFEYVITDEVGIHARPAGMLVNTVKPFESEVTIEKGGKSANAARLMALIGLGVKCGDTIKVTINGADEEAAAAALQKFLTENL